MNIRSALHLNPIFICILSWEFVWLTGTLVSFELITLLKAHLEVVLALSCHLQFTRGFVEDIFGRLFQTVLVLG